MKAYKVIFKSGANVDVYLEKTKLSAKSIGAFNETEVALLQSDEVAAIIDIQANEANGREWASEHQADIIKKEVFKVKFERNVVDGMKAQLKAEGIDLTPEPSNILTPGGIR